MKDYIIRYKVIDGMIIDAEAGFKIAKKALENSRVNTIIVLSAYNGLMNYLKTDKGVHKLTQEEIGEINEEIEKSMF